MSDPLTIAHDALWPRDAAHRYRVYGRLGKADLTVLAVAPEAGGIGQALVTLHRDAKEAGVSLGDAGQIGVYDVIESEWIVLPWNRGDAYPSSGPAGVLGVSPQVVDLAGLRASCEYDPEGEGSVDDLIAYKDALEDLLGTLPGVEVTF